VLAASAQKQRLVQQAEERQKHRDGDQHAAVDLGGGERHDRERERQRVERDIEPRTLESTDQRQALQDR
jgi:hypothetical protein